MAQNNPGQQLSDLLVTRGYDPEMLDSAGKAAPTAQDAEIFSFDFVTANGTNHGSVVVMLGDDKELTVFSGDNVGRNMDSEDKTEWYDFQHQLKNFATKNFMTFGSQNINKLKYSMQGQAALKEGLCENWNGTKNVSWNGGPDSVRLMIRHKRPMGVDEARHRQVESLFVETADGERHRLSFRSLAGGRAMVEHVRQGGKPYDMRGQHIANMVEELNVLSRFRRASKGQVFEGNTANLVAEANRYYETMCRTVKGLSSSKGYTGYFESWNPGDITEQDLIIEDIKTLFVQETIDSRIEQALPILARIQQQGTAMKEANIFEAWAERLVEGTWATPNTPEQKEQLIELLSQELPVGADATNAKEQLYSLFGDDVLFDQLQELADADANADARELVIARMTELADGGLDSDLMAVLAALESTVPEPQAVDSTEVVDTPAPVAEGQGPSEAERLDHYHDLKASGMDPDAAEEEAYGTDDWYTDSIDEQDPIARMMEMAGIPMAEGQDATTYTVAYKDPSKPGKSYSTQVKATSAAEAKAAFQEWDTTNRFTYLGSRPDVDTVYEDQGVAESAELNTMLKYAGIPVAESRVLDEAGETIDHILNRFKHEVKQFEAGNDMDSDLYEALFDYYSDSGDMPYGIAKARTGDPFTWVSDKLAGHLGVTEGITGEKILGTLAGTAVGALAGNYLGDRSGIGTLGGAAIGGIAGNKIGAHAGTKTSAAEGWKGQLAGGTVGGTIGTLAGQAVAGPLGAAVGGALGGTAGGMIGNALGGEDQLNEVVGPIIAAGARLLLPQLQRIGPALGRMAAQSGKSIGQAAKSAAPVVGQVAKQGAEIAAKNAGSIGTGIGAYQAITDVAKGLIGGVGEIYNDTGSAAEAIIKALGSAVDEKTVVELASAAVKYAIPIGILLAVLYGGKKLIDQVMSEGQHTQHGMDANAGRDDYEDEKLADIEPMSFKQDPIQATTDRALKYSAQGVNKLRDLFREDEQAVVENQDKFSALSGQYGHSGKLQKFDDVEQDVLARLKQLSGMIRPM